MLNRNAETNLSGEVLRQAAVCRQDWTPRILEDHSGGVREIEVLTKHLTDRKIFITGEITDDTANDFAAEILHLSKSGAPIDIYINSPGGSVNAGLVIYDTIQACEGKIPINVFCVGMAASMAAILLAGGQRGRRFILPHSKVMIHEPLIAGGVGGSATSIKKTAESILETKEITDGILAKHTGKTPEEIDEATSFDNFMNAEEAIAFGLCDEIKNLI